MDHDLLADEAATCDGLDSPFLADTFADWVYGEVMAQAGHRLPARPSPAMVDAATVATLLTTALHAAQQQHDALAAQMLREMFRRFESRGQ
jgi:hypothetical protein